MMNVKDLEALIKAQGTMIEALQHSQREWMDMQVAAGAKYDALRTQVERLEAWIGAADADGPFHDEFKQLRATCDELDGLVKGRNKSAATKRNMTDDDAKRVLTGDLASEDHKAAAELATLTYAQVYSCRLEYTFKHVHKELRDSGWKNPWAKKG